MPTRQHQVLDARLLAHAVTTSGLIPEVAPSTNHLDGTWEPKHIYMGEFCANLTDARLWMRFADGVREIFVLPTPVTPGDMWYANTTGGIGRLPIGSDGQALSVLSGLPAWVSTTTYLVPIELAALQALVTGSDLVPGTTYRITDSSEGTFVDCIARNAGALLNPVIVNDNGNIHIGSYDVTTDTLAPVVTVTPTTLGFFGATPAPQQPNTESADDILVTFGLRAP